MDQNSISPDVFQTQRSVQSLSNCTSSLQVTESKSGHSKNLTTTIQGTPPLVFDEPRFSCPSIPSEPTSTSACLPAVGQTYTDYHGHPSPQSIGEVKLEPQLADDAVWQPPPVLSPWELYQGPPSSNMPLDPQVDYISGGSQHQQCQQPHQPHQLYQHHLQEHLQPRQGQSQHAPPVVWLHAAHCQCGGCDSLRAQLNAVRACGSVDPDGYCAPVTSYGNRFAAGYGGSPLVHAYHPADDEIRGQPSGQECPETGSWEWNSNTEVSNAALSVVSTPVTQIRETGTSKRRRAKNAASAVLSSRSSKKVQVKRRKRAVSRSVSPPVHEELVAAEFEAPHLQTPPVSDSTDSGTGATCNIESVGSAPPNTSSNAADVDFDETVSKNVDDTIRPVQRYPRFSMEEECVMMKLREEGLSWSKIATLLSSRGTRALQVHYNDALKCQYRDWDSDHDLKLVSLVNQHERAMWDTIAERFADAGIKGVTCRYRYVHLHDQQMRSIDNWVLDQKPLQ